MKSFRDMRRRWPLAGALALGMVLSAGASAASATEGAGAAGQEPPPATHGGGIATLTLITGDTVMVEQPQGGLTSVTVMDPAERAGEVSFDILTFDEQTYVVPSDAAEYIPEVLDLELFNVTKLAEYGYHDGVPVIMGYEHAMLRPLSAPVGASLTADLPSIDAVAATIDPQGDWWDAVAPSRWASATPAGVLAGVNKVWLDEIAEVQLDESVAQVGAPQAWDAGFDGAGVTVAVLDTGIDIDHPDLVGQVIAAENFTFEEDTGDGHGHGTHVASTVAGTGAASNGAYTGVAPGAQLLNGKVCDSNGSCPNSVLIDGMEWAATQGADIVNVSIGGARTDGTDPLSMAVNNLTEEHGVLYVVSAGNSGALGDHSITAPGSADAALTVGSVDKSDELANSSSRGPRLGDFAIKPEITAPGVAIGAARADGTSLGNPIDDHYTSASGTSMAAPHVAGAAAIALQHSPDLGWAGVKELLSSTAVPNDALDVYEQGGGRLDIEAALDSPVLTAPSSLNLGYFQYPHDDAQPATGEVTYTNRTDDQVELDLTLGVENRDGDIPDRDMLAVSPDTISIPAGENVQVTVTLDVSIDGFGLYGGYLVASSDDDVVTRTPVGFYKESERYDLIVEGIDRDGQPATNASQFHVANVVDTSLFVENLNRFTDGVATLRVPPGTYSVLGTITTLDGIWPTDRAAVGDPEVEVTEDTTVVLDAREANEITFETEEAAELQNGVEMAWYRGDEQAGSWNMTNLSSGAIPQSAAETAPVTVGEFDFVSRHRLMGDGVLYDLVDGHSDYVPEDLHVVADKDVLVTQENRFYGEVGSHVREARNFWRPTGAPSGAYALSVDSQVRTEYLFGGENLYVQRIWYDDSPTFRLQAEPITFYEAGEQRVKNWFRQVMRPGVFDGGSYDESEPTTRTISSLTVRVQEWVDSEGNWSAAQNAVDTTAFRLYEDGDQLAVADRPQGSFAVSPDAAEHRLEVDVDRDAQWWTTSTSTRTAWTLPAVTPEPGQRVVMPLLEVDYDTELDLQNTAPHPRDTRGPATLNLQVRHQPEFTESVEIAGANVWVSFDDGDSWQGRPVQSRGDGAYQSVLPQRGPGQGAGYVSVRVEAWDAEDNRIEQEITRAWRLPER